MVHHDKSIKRNETIIALMWIYVLPSWIFFGYLFFATSNGLIVLLAPIVPYLALLLMFLNTKAKTKKYWVLVLFAGIVTSLPELFLSFIFFCWSNNSFAP
ncbi:hypothetical protein [Desulfovibrio sp. JC022]|uniref:hypothetical protein n=1 Tax=Desulfovibrio sp. JC022 TaxID=2593642 RepID=UPI0013D6E452|nr:hypothetical protein [Desulfovibrio sp. JC022]NDV24246.1 hypothetical protein [Desulfovibrio sp. JC022]